MNYYEVALLKSPLQPLTYQSEMVIEKGPKVTVHIKNRKQQSDAVMIKKVEKPDFCMQ